LKPRIIADAKYKPIGSIGSDYLQILAYMFRFDARIAYFLYPEAQGHGDLELRMNRGSTYEKHVTPRDDVMVVKIPAISAESNYAEFAAEMKHAEREFTSVFLLAWERNVTHCIIDG
jgi:hypothetical protein